MNNDDYALEELFDYKNFSSGFLREVEECIEVNTSMEISTIPLSKDKITIIDAEDYEWLMNGYKWSIGSGGYAVRHKKINSVRRLEFIHRVILEHHGTDLTDLFVDHINQDKLDNRKCNLRPATNTQNQGNTKKRLGSFTSKYKGVSWHKERNNWQTTIRINGIVQHLGAYQTEAAAALAYNTAAIRHHGDYACLNEVLEHEIPESLEPIPHNVTSKYRGVSWKDKNKKWAAQISINGQKKHIGLYMSETDAAIAYNDTARKVFGNTAKLNEFMP